MNVILAIFPTGNFGNITYPKTIIAESDGSGTQHQIPSMETIFGQFQQPPFFTKHFREFHLYVALSSPFPVLPVAVYYVPRYSIQKSKGEGLPQQAEVALGVPGRLRPRIFLTFGTTRVVGHQPYAPAAFTPGEIPGTHFWKLRRHQGTWFRR